MRSDRPEKDTRLCTDPWRYLEVSASGGVKPCCNYEPLEHLSGKGVVAARRSEAFRKLRMQLLTGELSSTCARCHIRRTVPVSALKAEVSAKTGKGDIEALLEPWPITDLRIDINEKCNLRCTYCAVSSPDYRGVEMTDAIFDQAEQIIRDGDTIPMVHVSGHGETTWHPKWVEYCSRLISLGARLSIITNLAKVYSPDEIALLSRFREIQISLDSADPDLMRKIRRAVRIDTIVANIERIRAAAKEHSEKAPEFAFSVGLYDPAVWKLLDFVKFIVACRATSVTFWNLVEYEHQSQVRALHRLSAPKQNQARAIIALACLALEEAGVRWQLAGDFLGVSNQAEKGIRAESTDEAPVQADATTSENGAGEQAVGTIPQSAAEEFVAEILASGFFDVVGYRAAAALKSADAHGAVLHYVNYGERRGLRPNKAFDPVFYSDCYPDLREWGAPLLLHFIRHGRSEGRIGGVSSDELEELVRPGTRPYRPACENVLLVCHDASRTGAPIIGWNLARQLRDRNVLTMHIGDGPLTSAFEADSSFVIGPLRAGAPQYVSAVVSQILRRWKIDFALINSVESSAALSALLDSDVPTVTLVHEFAEYVMPRGRTAEAVALSNRVVFPAEIVRASAIRECDSGHFRNTNVFSQGVCVNPPMNAGKIDGTNAAALPSKSNDSRFLVVGCGAIQIRKGVDLFLSVAQKTANALGRDCVRFVWAGAGLEAHDTQYSLWLMDQVTRADLEGVVEFLGELGPEGINALYRSADAMLLSSRLDPFPNAAIDAMSAGVPVVCFDRTTGVAEFLASDESSSFLIAPYLDVERAADILCHLAADGAARLRVGARIRARAAETFDPKVYAHHIGALARDARAAIELERKDVATIVADKSFSVEMSEPFDSPADRETAARRYVRFESAGGRSTLSPARRPAVGFNPAIYSANHEGLQRAPFENPFAHFLRAGKPDGPWKHSVITPAGRTRELSLPVFPKLSVALHLHLYYPKVLEEVMTALAVNGTPCDILVSTDTVEKARAIEQILLKYEGGRVIVRTLVNRGRDLGPFFTGFADEIIRYDIIGHLHGKQSPTLGYDFGDRWRRFLFQHLVGDIHPMLDLIVAELNAAPQLGLVFAEDPHLIGWTVNRTLAAELGKRVDPKMALPDVIEFPVGSMFWARTTALKPLFDLGLTWDDYPAEPLPDDGSMLHALERLLTVVCEHEGFRWATTHVPGVRR